MEQAGMASVWAETSGWAAEFRDIWMQLIMKWAQLNNSQFKSLLQRAHRAASQFCASKGKLRSQFCYGKTAYLQISTANVNLPSLSSWHLWFLIFLAAHQSVPKIEFKGWKHKVFIRQTFLETHADLCIPIGDRCIAPKWGIIESHIDEKASAVETKACCCAFIYILSLEKLGYLW